MQSLETWAFEIKMRWDRKSSRQRPSLKNESRDETPDGDQASRLHHCPNCCLVHVCSSGWVTLVELFHDISLSTNVWTLLALTW